MNFRVLAAVSITALFTYGISSCKKDEGNNEPITTTGSTTSSSSGTTTVSTTTTTSGTSGTTSGSTNGSTTGTAGPSSFWLGQTLYTIGNISAGSYSGFHRVVATTADAPVTCTIYLAGPKPVANKTYNIVPYTGAANVGTANIVIFMGTAANNAYKAQNGQLQVTVQGNVITASYSNVLMKSEANGAELVSSGTFSF